MDIVFHLAARVSYWGRKKLFFEVTVDGTRNLLQECTRVKRLVYFSSIAAYGVGRHMKGFTEDEELVKTGIPYGDSKIEAEKIVREFHERKGVEYTTEAKQCDWSGKRVGARRARRARRLLEEGSNIK